MKVVMKFGGTSVSDGERIRRVVGIVQKSLLEGKRVAVVVSAMAEVTDGIISALRRAMAGDRESIKGFVDALASRHCKAAKEVVMDKEILEKVLHEIDGLVEEFERVLISILYLREATPRSQDYILSFGEKLSTAIVCAALQAQNLDAKWFTGGEAGIITDDRFGEARPLMGTTVQQVRERIGHLLEKGMLPVITGYIACTQDDVTTTLGRGGSDYTATILGSALDVDEVWIWTDVDGLMTADPRVESSARTISRISYEEAMEMAYFGAKAMHPKALEPVADKGIPVRIKNTFNPDGLGTLVVKEPWIKAVDVVKSVMMIRDVALITVSGAGMVGTPGVAAKVFSIMSENRVNILMISQSSSEANISFIVLRSSLDKAVNTLELSLLGGDIVKDVSSEEDVCVVAVVGAGMKGIPGVAARVFRAIASEGINVRMIAQGGSELNISFVVREEDGVKAVRALHKEFRLDELNTA